MQEHALPARRRCDLRRHLAARMPLGFASRKEADATQVIDGDGALVGRARDIVGLGGRGYWSDGTGQEEKESPKAGWHRFQVRKCRCFRGAGAYDSANKLATVAANIARAAGRKKIPTEWMAKALNPKSRAIVIHSNRDRPPRPATSVRITW